MRVIYEYSVGDLRPDQRVYQKCKNAGNQKCIQPRHLFACSIDKESPEWQQRKRKRETKDVEPEEKEQDNNPDKPDFTKVMAKIEEALSDIHRSPT
jgi:hypothetical protein